MDKMQTGLGSDTVEAAIKLIAAAKQMGVASFSLGEFKVSFQHDTIFPMQAESRGPAAARSSPFDDPDLWLTLNPPAK